MEKIGELLKEKRLELGYSLQQMQETTKLSIPQLEAIESGNIAYFKDDLSYLSYFVRYYANALNVNYDELRSELDLTITEYTNAISLSHIRRQESINSNIKKKTENKKGYTSTVMSNRKKNVDFRSILLVFLAIFIVVSLGWVLIKYVPTLFNSDPISRPDFEVPNTKPDTGEEKPSGETGSGTETDKNNQTPSTSTLKITQAPGSTTAYEIRGLKADDKTEIKFLFANASWTSFAIDNVTLQEPKATTYSANSEAKIETTFKNNRVVAIRFGKIGGNTIEINGVKVPLDASLANQSVANITLKFVEGEN